MDDRDIEALLDRMIGDIPDGIGPRVMFFDGERLRVEPIDPYLPEFARQNQ